MYRRVPTGFVPDADQGYIMVVIQAPQGASLDYTMNIVKQVEEIVKKMPETDRLFARRRIRVLRLGAEPGDHVPQPEGLGRSGRARNSPRRRWSASCSARSARSPARW